MQALRRGTPLTPEQKESIAPERSHIITVYRELQARRWHAEDLQPLFAKLGEENTGRTLVAISALEQVGLITAADRGGQSSGNSCLPPARRTLPMRHLEMSGGDALVQVEALHAAAAALALAMLIHRHHDDRASGLFHKAGATMPMTPGCQSLPQSRMTRSSSVPVQRPAVPARL